MSNCLRTLITGVLLASSLAALAQQRPPQLKTIPDLDQLCLEGH